MDDAVAIAAVEAQCFPAAEAATAAEVRDRLAVYPDHFWLMIDDEVDCDGDFGNDADSDGDDEIRVGEMSHADRGDGTDGFNAAAGKNVAGTDDDATMVADGRLVAFVNGFVTDEPDLTDEMYADAAMHNEHGAWQMIFGVDTAPAYQHHGYATQLLRQAIYDARRQGRKGLVLTCKERLIGFYARLGFENEGISESTHGNVVWYQMRLRF